MFSLQSWLSKSHQSKGASHQEVDPFASAGLFSRFGAMPKLVDRRELAELSTQAGFNPPLLRKLRLERRRAYLLYLAELQAQFDLLERAARNRAANDPNITPEFAEQLVVITLRFTCSIWLLRLSTLLPALRFPKTYQWTVDLVGAPKH